MIPFDKIYSWLFKSFNIHGETELVNRLIQEQYTRMMIVKRSWIFGFFTLWIPGIIFLLSLTSILIALYNIDIPLIRNTIIIGNIVMDIILTISSLRYIFYFRKVHAFTGIWKDPSELERQLDLEDRFFVSFFNWSILNQIVLIGTIILEIGIFFILNQSIMTHIWIVITDSLIMLMEIMFLSKYRKRMMDLEMDYNVIVPGKIFFVNQSGILSSMQTIESDKIKTVRSSFPNGIASFFNFGTIDILTEGDSIEMLGTMTMYYVEDPDTVVANIELLLSGKDTIQQEKLRKSNSKNHTVNTQKKVEQII
jgi:hypothetical protein